MRPLPAAGTPLYFLCANRFSLRPAQNLSAVSPLLRQRRTRSAHCVLVPRAMHGLVARAQRLGKRGWSDAYEGMVAHREGRFR